MNCARKLANTGVCLLLLLVACSEEPAEPGFRHIVLIGIDGLRGDHLGYRGYLRPVSPFLDKLAGQSVDFQRAYAAAPHRVASYGSLFTSLGSDEHGLFGFDGQPLAESATTLAEALSKRGYRTAAFLGIRADWARTGLGRGFETVDTPSELHTQLYRPAGTVVDEALEWLDGLNPDDRVFMFLEFADVGLGGQAAPEHFAAVRQPTREALVEFAVEQHKVPFGFFHYENRVLADAFNRYDIEIRHVDAEISRLYRILEESGWAAETLWVVTSPYGMGLGNHFYLGAPRHIYEVQVRVPLWIHTPGGEYEARVVDQVVGQVDLAPTVLELAGSERSEPGWRGRSLEPVLEGGSIAPRAVVVQRGPTKALDTVRGEAWSSGADLNAIVEQRWKLLRDASGVEEIYDVEDDPFEQREGGAPQSDVERLRRLLDERLSEHRPGNGG